MLKSLTGRFLFLTIIFVMVAEVLIFVPSIARFRYDYLSERLERAQIASLSLLATPNDMIDPDLEQELLLNAGVSTIALRRDDIRELVLALPMPDMVSETFDLREPGIIELIMDALRCLVGGEDRTIRVVGEPVKGGGTQIEITLDEGPLRAAMLAYGQNIFFLSLLISIITAALLFFAVRRFVVRPMQHLVGSIVWFQDAPEDVRRVIQPSASVQELRHAEAALGDMQRRITQSLKQKERLAQLGGAVSRVSHDLRNMLTTAQLIADRLEASEDPAVARTTPKLIGSLDRAINLCEQTLAFGKAEEPAPELAPLRLSDVFAEVVEAEKLRTEAGVSDISAVASPDPEILADREQLYRVLINLARNARQAIENSGEPGTVRLSTEHDGAWVHVLVSDTGPGLPAKARENLFRPFDGGARRGGNGLGLAIAAELVAGHGGRLDLIETGDTGTTFRVSLPMANSKGIPTGQSTSRRTPASMRGSPPPSRNFQT